MINYRAAVKQFFQEVHSTVTHQLISMKLLYCMLFVLTIERLQDATYRVQSSTTNIQLQMTYFTCKKTNYS